MGTQKLKPVRRRKSPARKPAPVVRFDVVQPTRVSRSRVEELSAAVEEQAAQLAKLREALRQQTDALDAMATTPAAPMAHGDVLETTLRDAHVTIVRGLEAVSRVIGGTTTAAPVPMRQPSLDAFVRAKGTRVPYEGVKNRIAAAAAAVLPAAAEVVVVSRGDDALLDIAGRRGRHFPQNDDGVYAGYHPSTSKHAIRHLEALREKGGEFLLFPATSAWWLDHYADFRRHLDSRYRLLFAEPDHCAIYDVRADRTAEGHSHD